MAPQTLVWPSEAPQTLASPLEAPQTWVSPLEAPQTLVSPLKLMGDQIRSDHHQVLTTVVLFFGTVSLGTTVALAWWLCTRW